MTGLSGPLPRLLTWRNDVGVHRWRHALACAATSLLTVGVLWWALLSDMQREASGLRARLATSVVSGTQGSDAAAAVKRLKQEIASREARWPRDAEGAGWAERVQQGVRGEAGLQLEQLRALREPAAGGALPDGQHPAHAMAVRLHADFDALMRWLNAYAEHASAVALQPLRIGALPDGSVRVEAHALAFRGVLPRGAGHPSGEAIARVDKTAADAAAHELAGPRLASPAANHRPLPVRNPFDATPLATALGLHRAAPRASTAGGGPDMARLREPLEAHELRDLRVVGILHNEQRRLAIVEAGGMHHSVMVGQYLGRQHGRVERITDTGLELTEWQQHEGRWSRVVLRLRIDAPVTGNPRSDTGGHGHE